MTKAMKILCICAGLFLINNIANAQLPIPLGVATKLPIGLPIPKLLAFGNFTYAVPQSISLSNAYNYGYGFEAGVGFGLGKSMIIGSTGLITYKPKSSLVSNYQVVPIKVGIRRYLIAGLFVNGQIGIAKETYTNTSGNSDNHTGFLYEAGGGIKILKLIELGAAYTGYTTGSLSGISTAKSFLIKAGIALKI